VPGVALKQKKVLLFCPYLDVLFLKEGEMTDKPFRIFSVLVNVAVNFVPDLKELINYKAMNIKYCACLSLTLYYLTRMKIASFMCRTLLSSVACLTLS